MPALLTNSPTVRTRYSMEDLRDRVLGDLGLRDNSFVTDQDVDRWAFEAQDALCREGRWYRLIDYLPTVSGITEYDLPTDCLAIEYIDWTASGSTSTTRRLYPATLEDIYQRFPYWRTTGNSSPLWYYIRGASSFGLYPTPDTSQADALTVVYTALAPEPEGDEDFYYAPAGFEAAIVAYCCWKASVKDAGGEGKLRDSSYAGLWAKALNDIRRQVNGIDQATPLVYGRQRRGRRGPCYPGSNYRIPEPS